MAAVGCHADVSGLLFQRECSLLRPVGEMANWEVFTFPKTDDDINNIIATNTLVDLINELCNLYILIIIRYLI